MTVPVVVVLFPLLDDHPGFEEAMEFVRVQTFVTDTVVERLDVAVLPRLTRRNVADTDLILVVGPQLVSRSVSVNQCV